MKKKKEKGVFVKGAGEESDVLGEQFLNSPEEFAKIYDLDPDKLSCPDIAHEAFDRGQRMASDIQQAKITPSSESMTELKEIAKKHLGEDYSVSLIPFGLKFRERIDTSKLDITATGSGTVTWLDTDADVDS